MPVPGSQRALIAAEKLTDYLLNEEHPVGRSKAKWSHSLGYDRDDPTTLEQDLLQLVRTSEDYTEKVSPFGTEYVVSGPINAPDGQTLNVATVWIIEHPDDRLRLVTAYPGEKR